MRNNGSQTENKKIVLSIVMNLDYPDSLGLDDIVRINEGPDSRFNEEQNFK